MIQAQFFVTSIKATVTLLWLLIKWNDVLLPPCSNNVLNRIAANHPDEKVTHTQLGGTAVFKDSP
jgi:hypothetical protein